MTESGYSKRDYQAAIKSIESGEPISDEDYAGQCRGRSQEKLVLGIPGINDDRASTVSWVSELHECMAPVRGSGILRNAIIHGSYGDYSHTSFSDVEITLVLSDGVTTDRSKLDALNRWRIERLNRLLVRIDPLQHHGPFYLWDDLMRGYDESILPIRCYEDAWAVEPEKFEFVPHTPADRDLSEPLRVTLNSLARCEQVFFRYGVTPYAIKRLLSNLVLLPAFLLQSKEIMCTKAEAIQRIRGMGVPQISEVIDFATDARENWPDSPAWLGALRSRFIASRIPSGRFDQFILSLYRRSQLQNSVNRLLLPKIPGYCREMTRLYESDSAL